MLQKDNLAAQCTLGLMHIKSGYSLDLPNYEVSLIGTKLGTVRIYLVIESFDRIALFEIHYDCVLSEWQRYTYIACPSA